MDSDRPEGKRAAYPCFGRVLAVQDLALLWIAGEVAILWLWLDNTTRALMDVVMKIFCSMGPAKLS